MLIYIYIYIYKYIDRERSIFLNPMSPLKQMTGFTSYHLNHVKPIVNPLLQKEQAGFQHRKSTRDQVVLLMQNIESSFSGKKSQCCVC